MLEIKENNILDMLDTYGEEVCQEILSSFSCPLNKDVEDFIRNKAISFAKQRIAITFLVFSKEKGQLIGYYTLVNRFVIVAGDMLSQTMQKKISKFSQYDNKLNLYLISMPLIAQLGKNYINCNPITGTELLNLACNRVKYTQRMIGGRTTYIECGANEKLYQFYTKNQFLMFGQRKRESNELDENYGLVQMLRYFK